MPIVKAEKMSLLDTLGKQPIEGYLVLSPGIGRWWEIFTGKKHAHASLFIRQGWFYIWIEPTLGFTEARIIPINSEFSKLLPENTEIIKFRRWREINSTRIPHFLAIFSCVEQIKAFLGIKNPLLLTPRQLARHLKK